MEEGAHEATSVRIDGRKLARAIQLRGLTSAEFAKLSRISPSTLSGIVAHDNPASTRVAVRIAHALRDTPVDAELAALDVDEDRAA